MNLPLFDMQAREEAATDESEELRNWGAKWGTRVLK
jgi:hypothetical protein